MNPGAMIPTDLQTGVEYTAWTGYGSPDNVTVLGTISTDTDASSVASSAVLSSASSLLTVKKGAYSDFQKIHLAPILKTGVVVYGEVNKWVPVSVWRMAGVTMAADGTTALKLRGMAGEKVVVTIGGVGGEPTVATCTVGTQGVVAMVVGRPQPQQQLTYTCK